jgi:HD superfamily phosphodiesterase
MKETGLLISGMIEYYASDVRRINHFLKVYGFAKAIGERTGLDEKTQEILEIAALTHDIGIKNSELKYKSAAGNYQELEGPPEARRLLERLEYEDEVIDRVCWLIAHHHSYREITEPDHRILVEADFLVNAFEDGMSVAAILSIKDKVFATAAGTAFLKLMYPR